MSVYIHINLNENLYLRDPQQTELGRKILQYSVLLIEEIGFESFTFKKLAERIHSTEASIYRYFENKQSLLTYLSSWYWEWVRYQINLRSMNIKNPEDRLKMAIQVMVDVSQDNPYTDFIDESALHRIVAVESVKSYHSRHVDEMNKEGFFRHYKTLVRQLADLILEINPAHLYPNAVSHNLLEMAHHHYYFAIHLPSLTNLRAGDDHLDDLRQMLEFFAFRLIRNA